MYRVPSQAGRRIIVTGANSGTGKEAARRLAAAGAEVVLAVRSPDKGAAAMEEIRGVAPEATLEVRRLDLADLSVVREFADGVLDDGRGIDALVNNAGVMAPPNRILTADGHELQWGSNFLGPFALTNLLLPRLLESDAPRVVTMSSAVAALGKIDFGDLDWVHGYRPFPAYAQSKLANLLMSLHLARVSSDRGWALLSAAAHPGYTNTNLQTAGAGLGSARQTLLRQLSLRFDALPSQDPEQGAEPLLFATADPGAVNGAYYGPDGRFGLVGRTTRVSPPRRASGPSLGRSLWAVAEDLTGTRLPE